MSDNEPCILVIDDDEAIRESFGDYFEDHGFRVLTAESGEVALDIIQTETPAAAIVDIRMSGMSGDDLIRKVYPQQLNCIFVICTGSPEYHIPAELLEFIRVSSRVFQKPVKNLQEIHQEVLRMMDSVLVRGGKIE